MGDAIFPPARGIGPPILIHGGNRMEGKNKENEEDKKKGGIGWSLVPPTILGTDNLNSTQKLLWGRINGLLTDKGYCYASNKWLGGQLGLKKETISNYISDMEDKGYLKRELIRNEDNEIIERQLTPLPEINTPTHK